METPGPTIVFCRTRQETNDLADALRLRGYSAEALHGDLGQADRDRVMRRFREGLADLLVATDVAARGLDIETVTHVINYDIPWDVEQYIHRIGRTGRAGRTGDAITLVEGRERRQLKAIEQMIGAPIKPARIPTAADIAARRQDLFRESLKETLEARAFDGHLATVEALSGEYDTAEIAAAALQMLWASQHSGPEEAAEELNADSERPEVGMTRLFIGTGPQGRPAARRPGRRDQQRGGPDGPRHRRHRHPGPHGVRGGPHARGAERRRGPAADDDSWPSREGGGREARTVRPSWLRTRLFASVAPPCAGRNDRSKEAGHA